LYLIHILGAFDLLPMTLRSRFEDLVDIARKTCPDGLLVKDSVPCLEGHIYAEQALYYHRIATSPLNKVVCEIGFNAGHSTVAFMVCYYWVCTLILY